MAEYEKLADQRDTPEFKKLKKDLLAEIKGKTNEELWAMKTAAAKKAGAYQFKQEFICATITEYMHHQAKAEDRK